MDSSIHCLLNINVGINLPTDLILGRMCPLGTQVVLSLARFVLVGHPSRNEETSIEIVPIDVYLENTPGEKKTCIFLKGFLRYLWLLRAICFDGSLS